MGFHPEYSWHGKEHLPDILKRKAAPAGVIGVWAEALKHGAFAL
jgi:hypothetical protein